MGSMAMVVILDLLLLAALLDDPDVIVQDGGDDGHHVGLDNPSADGLGASYADVNDALEGQVPLPHIHHVLAAALLEEADQPLDAAIDGKDIPNAGGGCGQVGEMVERINQR